MRTAAKRSVLVLTITAAAVIALYVIVTLPPAEPRYAGKKLSYWLPRVHNQALPAEQQMEVRRAVTTIGTNNLQRLLKWFREPEPPYKQPWQRRLIDWANSKQHLIRFSRPMSKAHHPSQPEMAFWVFNEFPSVAAGAIPAFTNMLSDKDDTVKGKSAIILGRIGKDALPTLSLLLGNDNATNRTLAAFAIGNVGPDAVPLIPHVARLLNDASPYPRLAAADALHKLNASPNTFVPTLLNCLRDGDSDTIAVAADTLARTTNAPPTAVLALLQILGTTTNQVDRVTIYGVIAALDSEAAAKVRQSVFPESR